jgi:hypothetical protein
MPHLDIRICDKDQTGPAFPEPEYNDIPEGKLLAAAVLEDGMSSGKTSVGFIIEAASGKVLVQTSAAILDGLTAAIRGAEQRWRERGN